MGAFNSRYARIQEEAVTKKRAASIQKVVEDTKKIEDMLSMSESLTLLKAIAAKRYLPHGPPIKYESCNFENAIAFLTFNALLEHSNTLTQLETELRDRYRDGVEIHITITPYPPHPAYIGKCTLAIEYKKKDAVEPFENWSETVEHRPRLN